MLFAQVADYIGQEEKTNLLAVLGIVIAVACLPFGSLAGYLSDHVLTRVGKRQPWLIFATLLAFVVSCNEPPLIFLFFPIFPFLAQFP